MGTSATTPVSDPRGATAGSPLSGPLPDPASSPSAVRLDATLLFHLNLDYSSIEVEDRPRVVRRCYEPLLALCERQPWLCLALEAPLHTLELVAAIEPGWIERLRALVAGGNVELVGSGDTQLAGPLVPASVNRWNQRLGREGYRALLGSAPETALVGEMAFSQGLVDAYLDAGYRTLVVEWNNARRTHPEWQADWRHEDAWTRSPRGRRVRVSWVDTLLFQKLQRCVMGELPPEDYREWVRAQAAGAAAPTDARQDAPRRHVFLYAGDAEVFGYRPGRYASEPPLADDEWARLERLVLDLRADGVALTTPGRRAREAACTPRRELTLCTAAEPVPVKKQPKYNVTRWGLTGRDDLGLNTACHARARLLEARGGEPEEWRELCRAWSSDLRTHLTERRWEEHGGAPSESDVPRREARTPRLTAAPRIEREGRCLRIATAGVELVLDLRRGLAIRSLAFPAVTSAPLVGTLPHGTFDDIDWAADFYSGHTVLEIPARRRVTDLEACEPTVTTLAEGVLVEARVPSPLGPLTKRLSVLAERVELELGLSAWGVRPLGILRTGFVTLLPDGWQRSGQLFVQSASGGSPERYPLEGDFDHGAPVSSLISARTALGATDGRVRIDDGRLALELAFEPERCAALPMLTHRTIAGTRFCRVAFSLGEIDETLVAGAPLRDFRLSIGARRLEQAADAPATPDSPDPTREGARR